VRSVLTETHGHGNEVLATLGVFAGVGLTLGIHALTRSMVM
jgi:hypothetical protein